MSKSILDFSARGGSSSGRKLFTKFNGGFTLIELLITLVIISTISSILLGIVWVSLRSTMKINNMHVIRQNGNFAVTQMSKMLQFAQRFEGVSTDGVTYTTACDTPDISPLAQYQYVKVTATDTGTIILSCENSPATVASNSASLINTASFTVNSCYFTCTQVSTDSPYTIGIHFIIAKKVGGNVFDDPSPLLFQTSSTIRNIYN